MGFLRFLFLWFLCACFLFRPVCFCGSAGGRDATDACGMSRSSVSGSSDVSVLRKEEENVRAGASPSVCRRYSGESEELGESSVEENENVGREALSLNGERDVEGRKCCEANVHSVLGCLNSSEARSSEPCCTECSRGKHRNVLVNGRLGVRSVRKVVPDGERLLLSK